VKPKLFKTKITKQTEDKYEKQKQIVAFASAIVPVLAAVTDQSGACS